MAFIPPSAQPSSKGGMMFVNPPGVANYRALRVESGDQHLYWQPTYQHLLRVEAAFGEFFPQAEFTDGGNQVIFTKYVDKVEVISQTRALRPGEKIPRGEWQRFLETWGNFKRLADRTDIPEDVRNFIMKFGPPSVERYPAAYRIYRPHWYSRSRLFVLWGLEPVGGAEFVSITPEEAISEGTARAETDAEESGNSFFRWLKILLICLLILAAALFLVWCCLPRPVVGFEVQAEAGKPAQVKNLTGLDRSLDWGTQEFRWSFANGLPDSSEEKTPAPVWLRSGPHEVTLEATRSTLWGLLFKTDSKTKSIVVLEPPTLALEALPSYPRDKAPSESPKTPGKPAPAPGAPRPDEKMQPGDKMPSESPKTPGKPAPAPGVPQPDEKMQPGDRMPSESPKTPGKPGPAPGVPQPDEKMQPGDRMPSESPKTPGKPTPAPAVPQPNEKMQPGDKTPSESPKTPGKPAPAPGVPQPDEKMQPGDKSTSDSPKTSGKPTPAPGVPQSDEKMQPGDKSPSDSPKTPGKPAPAPGVPRPDEKMPLPRTQILPVPRVSIDDVAPLADGKAQDIDFTLNLPNGVRLERLELDGKQVTVPGDGHFKLRLPTGPHVVHIEYGSTSSDLRGEVTQELLVDADQVRVIKPKTRIAPPVKVPGADAPTPLKHRDEAAEKFDKKTA
jgi:hypothetical protein